MMRYIILDRYDSSLHVDIVNSFVDAVMMSPIFDCASSRKTGPVIWRT